MLKAAQGMSERRSNDGWMGSIEAKVRKGECNRVRTSSLHEGPGHYGVCNSCRSAGGDSYCGHHAFSAEDPRAMGRHSRWHKRTVGQDSSRRIAQAGSAYSLFAGQGTVEYALVTIAVFAAISALFLIVNSVSDGGITQRVLDSLTHRLLRGVLDIALF